MELFERWRETCAANRMAWAIRDALAARQWTFGELDDALAARPRAKAGSVRVATPEAGLLDFVLDTLQAWRDEQVLLPLETCREAPVVFPEAPAGCLHWKTTSGSTGGPRRVAFTAAQLAADHDQIVAGMRLQSDAPNVAVISPAHSYGFSNLVLPLLLSGMPMLVPGNPLPGTMRKLLAEAVGPVTLPAVPVMWRAWLRAGLLETLPCALAITAGAPMPLELEVEIFERSGLKVHNFYGASECGGIAFDDREEPRASAAEVGRPLPAAQVSVDADGCLEVRGPAVALGYAEAAEDEERLRGGVFRSGDLARFEAGRVLLEGRATDTIHIAGRKVAPQAIEAHLQRQPGVRHCVVFGIASDDPDRVQDIIACVNTEEGVSSEDLQRRLGQELPAWQIPRRWWRTADLVPDVRGKISRAQWRERFQEAR